MFRNEKPLSKVKDEKEEIVKKIVLMEIQAKYFLLISKF